MAKGEAKDLNAPENAPDMTRYYYRPGTTEPELRPEFANETPAPAPAKAPEVAVAKPDAEKPAAKKPVAKKK